MISRVAALFLLMVPATGFAQAAPPPPARSSDTSTRPPAAPVPTIVVTGEKEGKEDERVVCESREETGSLFRKRVCRTVSENEEATTASGKLGDEFTADRDRRLNTQTLICAHTEGIRC
jgi:hypothetical protein